MAGPEDPIAKKAGAEIFEKYSYINRVDTLANGDLTKWDEVMQQPYERMLTKLMKNKDEYVFNKKYSEILRENSQKK